MATGSSGSHRLGSLLIVAVGESVAADLAAETAAAAKSIPEASLLTSAVRSLL